MYDRTYAWLMKAVGDGCSVMMCNASLSHFSSTSNTCSVSCTARLSKA